MRYSDLIKQLYALSLHGGVKLGLQNSQRLDQALDYPSRAFMSIHIAGTNGKGSVTTKIAKALQHSGLKVGLYTSPHVSCFRERIKINDEMISESQVERLLSQLLTIANQKKISATFFEMTTLLAFRLFAQERVGVAVLETGLGGRLDATNIVMPTLTAITSISLEHTQILGNTLEQIAQEKAGIIKPHVPIIVGPNAPYPFIRAIAEKFQSPCTQVTGTFASFDQENHAIAKACLETLKVHPDAIERGLKAIPPCRMEIVNTHPSQTIILDVAHNPDGFSNLIKSIKIQFPKQPLKVVCGLSKTKDIPSCLSILKPHVSHFYPVTAPNGRGISPLELHHHLTALNIPDSSITLQPTITQAIEYALKQNSPGILLVCGSFFIMSEARKALGIEEPCDQIDINER